MKHQLVWKLSALSASILFFLSSSARAATLNRDGNVSENETAPLQLAQSYCPDSAGGSPLISFYETSGFWIYICSADGLYYHGIEKGSGNYITLPAFVEEGTGYVAENGDYTYIVNGVSLSIYEGNTLLQEEFVW